MKFGILLCFSLFIICAKSSPLQAKPKSSKYCEKPVIVKVGINGCERSAALAKKVDAIMKLGGYDYVSMDIMSYRARERPPGAVTINTFQGTEVVVGSEEQLDQLENNRIIRRYPEYARRVLANAKELPKIIVFQEGSSPIVYDDTVDFSTLNPPCLNPRPKRKKSNHKRRIFKRKIKEISAEKCDLKMDPLPTPAYGSQDMPKDVELPFECGLAKNSAAFKQGYNEGAAGLLMPITKPQKDLSNVICMGVENDVSAWNCCLLGFRASTKSLKATIDNNPNDPRVEKCKNDKREGERVKIRQVCEAKWERDTPPPCGGPGLCLNYYGCFHLGLSTPCANNGTRIGGVIPATAVQRMFGKFLLYRSEAEIMDSEGSANVTEQVSTEEENDNK